MRIKLKGGGTRPRQSGKAVILSKETINGLDSRAV